MQEAVELLAEHEDAKLLAGGHSLIPLLRLRLARIPLLVDIGRLDELRYIRDDRRFARDRGLDLTRRSRPRSARRAALHRAGRRRRSDRRSAGATPGGRSAALAHADPAADLGAVLLAADAELVARGLDGERTISIADFPTGVFEAALGSNEVLTEIRVPKLEASTYLTHSRRAHDWATVGVTVAVSADG